ncbi:uncharacterized protein [Dermacentor albipictus]|uniref:uncharacterized protein isoform X2 n=1 Tax=Dermacentor albipictus TaxID=60249 RepID=UPI0031FE2E29
MWTDDTGDEIVSISTESLQEQPWQTVRVAGGQSLGQRFLGSKFSILLLAAIAVLFAGVLPFVAFRAAILSSSRALAAASAVTSRLARTASSSVNRQAQDAVTAFDVVMAQTHDHGLAPADHHSIERNAVKDSGDPHGGRAHQPLRTQRHHAVVAHDELLPQVMEHPKPCDSPACQREALNISEQLDESVSPCDDFYTHVCGRWTQRVAVPNGSARVSVDTLTQDHLTHLVDGAFRRYSEELERVADLYNECRSHKSGDFERALFDELVGGFGNVSWYLSIRTMAGRLRKSVWPTFRDVGDTKLSASIGAFYRTVNEPALFSIKPTTDSDFPNETLISVGLPTLVMGSFIQHSPKMRDDSNDYNYVSDAMDMILRQSNLTHGIKVNVLNVELTLARAIGTAVPEAPRLVQVQELPSTGKLKWDALFRSMMAETDTNFSSVYVSVDSMRYLYALQEALHELQDVEILAYLGFRTKLVLAPLLMDNDSLSLLGALAVSPFPEWHPPLSREHYCVRFFEKFEPALSLYAARDGIGRRLRRLRAASLVDALRKAVHEEMAALFPKPFLNHVSRILRSAKWTALMPDWAHTALLRAKYVDYFYSKVGRAPVHQQFSLLIKLKNANQYQRYLTGIFFDAPWTGGLLRTSATVGEDRVDVPPGVFDFFRADEPSLVPLQMARLGPRVATSVYRFVFAKALDFLYHTGHQKSWVLLDDARSCVWSQFSAGVWISSAMGAGRSTHSDGSPAHSPTRLLDKRLARPRHSDDHGFHGALLSPTRVCPPISSPPPRPAVDDRSAIPSPPPASMSSRVPVVTTTRVTSTSGERRHSMRADSPMPKLQAEARRLSEPRDEQARSHQQQGDIESQIREIEQMTDGILEDIEAENLGSFSTGHDPATKTTALKGPHQDVGGPLDSGKSAAPLRGSFERGLFGDAGKFTGLGRPQLPPTRSLERGGRRASVPWETAVAGSRSGGHRYKPHSRSTGSEVRSQSQPVAGLAAAGRHGAQMRTQFSGRAETTHSPFLGHVPRNKVATTQLPVTSLTPPTSSLMHNRASARSKVYKIERTIFHQLKKVDPLSTTHRKNSYWKTSKRNTPSHSTYEGFIAIHSLRWRSYTSLCLCRALWRSPTWYE